MCVTCIASAERGRASQDDIAREAWTNRESHSRDARLLPLILSGCAWSSSPQERREAYEFLDSQEGLRETAIQLLDVADSQVRCFAMQTLLRTDDLHHLAFLLAAALASEQRAYSPLVDVLFRAVHASPTLAHALFWACHGLADQSFGSLFRPWRSVLLQVGPPGEAALLAHDLVCVSLMMDCANDDERRTNLQSVLAKRADRLVDFRLPTARSHCVTAVDVEHCKSE